MAITTIYRGIEYRSRLEARWASFFTGLGWHFTYEPFDGDGYIPDFLIHGERPLLVEVKPAVQLRDYQSPVAKAQNGLRQHWAHDIIIVGADPFPRIGCTWGNVQFPPAGWLGEFYPGDENVPEVAWTWGPGNWFTCGHCEAAGIFHDHMTFVGRPCGHYDGDHYLSPARAVAIQATWANACNDVKWRGREAA